MMNVARHKTGPIIVFDYDEAIRRSVTGYFKNENFPVSAASNRIDFNSQLASTDPSLIILDLRPGEETNLDLLKDIRSHSNVPVIITTHHCIDEIDRVVGLEFGADDFIVKPFSLRGLLARVRAILRRVEIGRAGTVSAPQRNGYRFGGWHLELSSRSLVDRQGDKVPLSDKQYALLLAFLKAPQLPLSREHLLQATGTPEDTFDRSIDTRVSRLRRKLERGMIHAERGFGYVFARSVELC